jgi:hypothetical protein
MPTTKNIIIFVAIGAILVAVYIFFFKPSAEDEGALVVAVQETTVSTGVTNSDTASLVGHDFLNLLLNVKTIHLDTTIFSDPAFTSLNDSSITLVPDGTEGRPNPFALFGNDDVPPSEESDAADLSAEVSTPE